MSQPERNSMFLLSDVAAMVGDVMIAADEYSGNNKRSFVQTVIDELQVELREMAK